MKPNLIEIRNYLIYIAAGFFFISHQYLSIVLLLSVALTLFTGELRVLNLKRIKPNIVSIAIMTFFLINLSALLIFSSFKTGFQSLETKLSFLLLPLILPLIHKEIKYQKIFFGLLVGIFLAYIPFIYSIFQPYLWYSIGNRISQEIHPSYFGIYIVFIHFSFIVYAFKHKLNLFLILIISTFLLVTILLTASKIAIISYFLLLPLTGIIHYRIYKNYNLIYLILIAFGIAISAIALNNALKTRFIQAYEETFTPSEDPNYLMSTGERLVAWKASTAIIGENPVFGVGVGNEKKELGRYYKEHNNLVNLELNLDAHQQFLQSWLSAGISGFISLIFIFVSGFYKSIKQRNFALFGLLLVFFLFCLTESVFERQAGVVFFSFFAVLLSYKNQDE